jgi:hypothetical protein
MQCLWRMQAHASEYPTADMDYIRQLKVLFEIPHPYSLYRHQWPKLTCGLS